MRKFIFAFLLIVSAVSAQDNVKYKLTNVTNKYGFSSIDILDSYLSPLVYTGVGLRYEHAESKYLLSDNDYFIATGKWFALAGMTMNPQYTGTMSYLGAAYSWGVHYRLPDVYGFRLYGGANVDANYAMKTNDRNVNNPYNMDMATNLNLSGIVQYDIATRKRIMRLNYRIETPVLGCMFVPEDGASYYEMFDVGILKNAFLFSSLHNKTGASSELSIDIPFQHTEWTFGLGSSNLKYKANNLLFRQNTVFLNVGVKYDLYIFSGMKNRAPANFRNAGL